MYIQNRNLYVPEIRMDFEDQPSIGPEPQLVEVRETLYADRVTTWYAYVPTCYREGTALPLVLQMHGGGGDGLADALGTDWARLAEERGFLVVFPSSNRYGRWECDEADIETLRRLIESVCRRYTVDRTRIYMQGMSNGDMITTAFALEHPELLAAVGYIAGPLPKEMLPHMPKAPLPCIQIRGEKDVRFGQKMEFERGDVYAPKSAMNDFSRCMWMQANHTAQVPQMFLQGKDNFFVYSGPCDVLYWEVKDMGHRYPANVAAVFWDFCYSGWAKVDGKSVRLSPRRTFSPPDLQFAVAVGGQGVFRDGAVVPFTVGSEPDCLLVHPARREEDPYYDVGEMQLTPAVYVPVEALAIGFGGTYALEENGRSAVFHTADNRTIRFLRGRAAVFVDGELLALKKPCFARFGLFFVPIVEVASEVFQCFTAETDGVVAVSSRPVELTKGAARILAHQLHAPARYPEPDPEAYFAQREAAER